MNFWSLQCDGGENELRIEGEITAEQDFFEWYFGLPDKSAPAIIRDIRSVSGEPLTVWINSPGGSVVAGSAIYTALRDHKGPVTVKIDGIAASAASVIAMGGDEVLMGPTSLMMIHNPMTFAEGDVSEMRKAIQALESCKQGIVTAYAEKTGLDARRISELMDAETFMSATQAIELGFADGTLFSDSQSMDPVVTAMKNMMRFHARSLDADMIRAVLNEPQPRPDAVVEMQRYLDLERARF